MERVLCRWGWEALCSGESVRSCHRLQKTSPSLLSAWTGNPQPSCHSYFHPSISFLLVSPPLSLSLSLPPLIRTLSFQTYQSHSTSHSPEFGQYNVTACITTLPYAHASLSDISCISLYKAYSPIQPSRKNKPGQMRWLNTTKSHL